MFGADFARLEPPQRLDAVKQLLAQYRVLLVWDNFESVREMPDPAGATPPLDEAGCAALRELPGLGAGALRSAVIITSRAREDWLGQVRRIGVGGLNRAEAAEYAGYLLAPFPAAQERRERRSFGELLEWLDGHPLAMRLTLPRLEDTDPADLLAALRGTTPLPAADDPDAGRITSLPACITYSYAHLAERTRRLLPAVSLFHGVADADVLMLFSAVEGVPGRFAGVSRQEWTAVLEDAARVGLLTGLGAGMYRIHPALPGYLAAGWHAAEPRRLRPGAGGVRAGAVHRQRRLQPVADRADRIRGRRPRLRHHRAAAADPGRDARPRPGPPGVGRRRQHRPGAGRVLGHPRPRRGSRRLGRPHPGRHRRPRPGPA